MGAGGRQGEVEVMMEGTATEGGACQGLQCILSCHLKTELMFQNKRIGWRQMVSLTVGC